MAGRGNSEHRAGPKIVLFIFGVTFFVLEHRKPVGATKKTVGWKKQARGIFVALREDLMI